MLVRCAQVTSVPDSCKLEELPLIGMEDEYIQALSQDDATAKEVIIKLVLDRLVISDPWMGTRFEEVLNELPLSLLHLFRSVTLVIIDADTRPAFFWTMTGGMYLDPNYLWLTAEEKETITAKTDYRDAFASKVPYTILWRSTLDGALVQRFTKTEYVLEDILFSIKRLLFHELGHANDFFPVQWVRYWKKDLLLNSIVEVAVRIQGYSLSNILLTYDEQAKVVPDPVLIDLAKALYGDGSAESVAEYSAAEIGEKIQDGGKIMLYSYYPYGEKPNIALWEDFAMLVETGMMKYLYNLDLSLAIAPTPEVENPRCQDFIPAWGVYRRMGNALVKARTGVATAYLYSGIPSVGPPADFYSDMAPETSMADWENWCQVAPTKGSRQNYIYIREIPAPPVPHETTIRNSDLLLQH